MPIGPTDSCRLQVLQTWIRGTWSGKSSSGEEFVLAKQSSNNDLEVLVNKPDWIYVLDGNPKV